MKESASSRMKRLPNIKENSGDVTLDTTKFAKTLLDQRSTSSSGSAYSDL